MTESPLDRLRAQTAEFIATARNHWDALLDVVEAAQRFTDAMADPEWKHVADCNRALDAALDTLTSSLSGTEEGA